MTNPAAVTVLCFGDSNTHGAPSDDEDYVRLAADVRWTGRLQRLLGDGYDVIEEGLSGRTTDLEYDDRPGCNGRPYFLPCLLSHQPLDVIVLMLGTNDLKVQFDRSPAEIAQALGGYVDDIASSARNGRGDVSTTLLLSPVHLDGSQPWFAERTDDSFDLASVEKSPMLAAEVRRVAHARGVLFADAATVARPGLDGLHLSLDSHARVAELVAAAIRQALPHLPAS
jgi:lysophospholipase L1-like esterase